MKFNELNLNQSIQKAINDLNYMEATPIQRKTIPLLLEGKNVLGCAQTGSGKTAAFLLPLLQKIDKHMPNRCRALIMTPTRELAMQIARNVESFAKYLDIKVGAIYGGIKQEEQEEQLKDGMDVIVATPGRLLDLHKQGLVSFLHVTTLVLDEADRMLDMGFINDILYLVSQCSPDAQKVMFSATMPKPIERLADRIMKDAITVMQDEVNQTVDSVNQFVYYVDEENKLALLTQVLKKDEVKKAIVFTNTRNTAELVSKYLLKHAIRARAIHSEKSQASRQDAILQFQKNHVQVLVATDVAARGIDINKVTHVINYDIPDKSESYIHRIGRTGRAGETGEAISLCCIDQMDNLRAIESKIQMTIPTLTSEWPMRIFQKKPKVVKKKKEEVAEDPFDLKKVKDVSLSGKPVKKKSNYQNYMQRKEKREKNATSNRGNKKFNRNNDNRKRK